MKFHSQFRRIDNSWTATEMINTWLSPFVIAYTLSHFELNWSALTYLQMSMFVDNIELCTRFKVYY